MNGHAPEEARYPGCANFSFAYVEGESLLMALKNVAVSRTRARSNGRRRSRGRMQGLGFALVAT